LREASRRSCALCLRHTEALLEVTAQNVRFNSQYDHDTNDDELKEDVDVEKVERVAEDTDHQCPNQGVPNIAASAEKTRSPDDHSRDRVEFRKVAEQPRASIGPPGEDGRRDPRT
jgi:hypothetical protein